MSPIEEYINIDDTILSNSEKQLHKHVRENLTRLTNMTIYEFADETLTSRATIDRYLKKLGINGFKQFKIILSSVVEESSHNLEIELLVNYLINNKQANIAVVGSGAGYIACDYLTRRMQTLGYFVHSYTFDAVELLKHNVELMIIISSSGGLKSKLSEGVIKEYDGITYAITTPEGKMAQLVQHVISNGKPKIQSKFERENMLSTIEIIEVIFKELIKKG